MQYIHRMDLLNRAQNVIEDHFDLLLGSIHQSSTFNDLLQISILKLHNQENVFQLFVGFLLLRDDDINK